MGEFNAYDRNTGYRSFYLAMSLGVEVSYLSATYWNSSYHKLFKKPLWIKPLYRQNRSILLLYNARYIMKIAVSREAILLCNITARPYRGYLLNLTKHFSDNFILYLTSQLLHSKLLLV